MAGRRGMDVLGVLVVAAVTVIGGGMVRDLLLDELVFWLADTSYLYAIAAATVCTLVYGRFRRPQHATLLVAYAIGPAVFAVLWAHTRGRWPGPRPSSQSPWAPSPASWAAPCGA